VVELVEAQRACSQLTWSAMQHLSSALERLCPSAEPPQTHNQRTHGLPPPLLLEAAGCARRLAHILVRLGEAPQSSSPPAPAAPTPPQAVMTRPSVNELQQQKARLRHVTRLESSTETTSSTVGMAEVLRNVVTRRRKSMETISSRTSTSSGAPSCWDV
jgi:hypothetical protein